MDNIILIFVFLQFVSIAFSIFKIRSLKKDLLKSEREVERLISQSKLLENNAAHSETVLKTYKDSNKLSVSFFTEEISESSLIGKRIRMRYKSQIYLNGIPVGSAHTLKEDVITSVDRQQVEKLLDKYALPFLEAGIAVANLVDGGKTSSIKSIASLSAESINNKPK